MIRYNLLICFIMMMVALQAQFINNGATVTIQPGAVLRIETDFDNQAGTIDNQGVLEVQGNFNSVVGPGTTLSGNGKIKFFGTTNSNLSPGDDVLNKVELLKTTSTGTVTLTGAVTVNDSLIFGGSAGGSTIILGANDLTLGATSTVTGASQATGYVVTGSTGQMKKTNLGATPFTYPVGFDAVTYNPVTIAENGTIDNIGVRVLQKAYANGSSGTALTTSFVDATWSISDATPGGNNLTITPYWKGSDEVSFNRTLCRVARYNGQKYDLDASTKLPAGGSDPYSLQRSGITNTGNFIVSSSSFVKVAPKLFLEGAYVVADGLMRDVLRANNKLPLAQPFGLLTFTGTYAASLNSDEAVNQSIFDVTGNNAVVDWVLLELRDNANRSIVHARRAALLQRDGDIVDIDGVSPVRFDNISDGNYHLSVRHRVHLGTRTATSLSLSETSTPINFTNNANAIANSQKELVSVGSGIYGILTGDVDRDGRILSGDIVAIGGFFNTSLGNFNYFTRSTDADLDGRIISGDVVSTGSNINKQVNLNQ
ncbi:MAG: hypothetical protein IPL55_21765 [Saprospiraceae bacterium]|nr:hypothetical protein [Saprospiraceae bacterium]